MKYVSLVVNLSVASAYNTRFFMAAHRAFAAARTILDLNLYAILSQIKGLSPPLKRPIAKQL